MDRRTRDNLIIRAVLIFFSLATITRYVASGTNRDRHNEDIATCAHSLINYTLSKPENPNPIEFLQSKYAPNSHGSCYKVLGLKEE